MTPLLVSLAAIVAWLLTAAAAAEVLCRAIDRRDHPGEAAIPAPRTESASPLPH